MVANQAVAVPRGSKVTVKVEELEEGRFLQWSALNTMADGSAEPCVTFVVTKSGTVKPIGRADIFIPLYHPGEQYPEMLGPFMWGKPAAIHSAGGFRSDAGYDGYSRTQDVQVVADSLDADLYADASSGGSLTHMATWNGGGYVLVGVREGYTLMNKKAVAFLGAATSSDTFGNGRVTAWADIGYTFEDRTEVFNFYRLPVGVAMKFIPLAALTLEVEGEGGAARRARATSCRMRRWPTTGIPSC